MIIRKETCPPGCRPCRFYAFNGDETGAYVGDGRCEHPDHPKRCEPGDGCEDFECSCGGLPAWVEHAVVGPGGVELEEHMLSGDEAQRRVRELERRAVQ